MAYDDYEQGERVREWLRHNGVAIIVGIAIGLALIFGYRQWNEHRANERADAATQYQLIESAYASGKASEAGTLAGSLQKNHADSAYAVFAAFLRARHELDSNQADKAVQSLQWAVEHAGSKPLKALSQLRLARAELDAGKADQALATLKTIPENNYTALVAELRGDAQVKLGHADAATKAYQAALAAFEPDVPQRNIVQMKIDNLAVLDASQATSAPATSTAATSSSPKQDT